MSVSSDLQGNNLGVVQSISKLLGWARGGISPVDSLGALSNKQVDVGSPTAQFRRIYAEEIYEDGTRITGADAGGGKFVGGLTFTASGAVPQANTALNFLVIASGGQGGGGGGGRGGSTSELTTPGHAGESAMPPALKVGIVTRAAATDDISIAVGAGGAAGAAGTGYTGPFASANNGAGATGAQGGDGGDTEVRVKGVAVLTAPGSAGGFGGLGGPGLAVSDGTLDGAMGVWTGNERAATKPGAGGLGGGPNALGSAGVAGAGGFAILIPF